MDRRRRFCSTLMLKVQAQKDDSVVLRVFTKMFYNHLGLYGSDLKLARLERYIEKKGLWEEFKQAYEAITESDWLKTRQEYNFLPQMSLMRLYRLV